MQHLPGRGILILYTSTISSITVIVWHGEHGRIFEGFLFETGVQRSLSMEGGPQRFIEVGTELQRLCQTPVEPTESFRWPLKISYSVYRV